MLAGLVARIEEPRPVPLDVASDRAELDELAQRPLAIQSGQLLAAAVLHGADGSHSVLLRLHHAAGDGWSIGLLVRDLSEVYAALGVGPCPAAGCRPSVRRLRGVARRRPPAGARSACWTTGGHGSLAWARSSRCRRHAAPAAPPRLAVRAAGSPARWIATLVDRVREFARTHRVTEYAVLLAATAMRIQRETGNADVAMRVPVSNRRRPEFEAIVGPFLETALARVDVSR